MSIFTDIKRRKKGWMNLRVARIEEDTHDTKTFYLEDAEEGACSFDYIAGQYLTFRFDDLSEKPIVRSYTMSSSPKEADYVAFTVKIVDQGLVSNWLCKDLKVGDILKARGPIGRFCYDPDLDPPHIYMVAGGSGVTPFISVMREFHDRLGQEKCPQSLNLLVSHRTRQDLICQALLDSISGKPGIKVCTTLTREPNAGGSFLSGHIDHQMLHDFFGDDLSNKVFLTCGPVAIMNTMVAYLREHGVPEERIKQESFF